LNNPDALIECETEGLLPKHFAIEANQIIYQAIMYLFAKNQQIDPLTISAIIKDEKAKKIIDDIGGLEYLLLLQQTPKTSNLSIFIQDVLQCHLRRTIYTICDNIQNDVINNTETPIDELIGSVNQKVNDLTLENTKAKQTYKMGDKLEERLSRIKEAPDEVPGIACGWDKTDRVTKGGRPGDLTIICAESKVGKSATLINWAAHIAIRCKLPILWIDTEQTEEEQEMRLLSIISQVTEDEIVTGLYTRDTDKGLAIDKIKAVNNAVQIIKESPLYFTFMPDFTIEKITALTRKFQLKHGIVALFFDYIKLPQGSIKTLTNVPRDIVLTVFTSGLKDIAGILKIPVYTASQENRFMDKENPRATKGVQNIGGSLGILQLATKLFFLRNKTDEEMAIEGNKKGNQKFHIKFQRHGGDNLPEINIMYDKERITQHEL